MFLMAGMLILSVSLRSHQAMMSTPLPLHFTGEYSREDGKWQKLDRNTRLSADHGTVILRGELDEELPEGAEVRFYLNHIGMEIYRNGECLYESSYERSPDMCGSAWVSWELPEIVPGDVLEIRLHNPHAFGNRNAYNQFLGSIYVGSDVSVKNYFDHESLPYKTASVFIIVASVALIGTAVGYRLLRLPDSILLLKAGVMSLMMGAYMYLDAKEISFWSGKIAFNTCARRMAMMIATWLLGACVVELLHGKRRKMAETAAAVLMLTDFLLMAVALTGKIGIYDTGIYWVVVQGAVNLFLLIQIVREAKCGENRGGLMLPSATVLLMILLFEFINCGMGWWRSGLCIKIIFMVLFVFHLVRASWLVAKNRQDSIRAEKLKEELKNSRIVLAMSQMRTHFVFNILNAISGMCGYNPQKADETLLTFSHYLRNNISIMEKDGPEAFTKSLEHLEEYITLEQVRFGDKIRFTKNIEAENFQIPPLALQPLVENAIRHGILQKKQGGTVTLHTWTENGDYLIEISDDGVGFDTAKAPEEGSVGMKNVRFRLEHMVGGTMEVTSTPGLGTTVTIRIPGKQRISKKG